MSKCGERVWHHAWYTGDAQCKSLAVLCPPLSSLQRRRALGQVSPQTLPTESGQRRSASCRHVCIGAGKQGQSHLAVACGLRAMSLNLWPPVFSYTGPLLGAIAVFSSPREPSCVWGITMARFSCRQEQPCDTVLAQEMEV